MKPAGVVIQLTKTCNYRCSHCSQNSFFNTQKGIKELDTNEWKNIIDKIKKTGTERIMFSGGEIFLRHDIRELSEYAKKLNFDIGYITNGSLLRQNLEWLSIIQPSSIRISIYSTEKKKYEQITKIPNSYSNVIRTIEELRDKNLNIVLYFVLTNSNFNEINHLTDLFYKYGIKKFRFLQLAKMGRAKKNESQAINLENFKTFWNDAVIIKQEKPDINIKMTLRSELFDFVNEKTNLNKYDFSCKLGVENNWFINSKGEMFLCCLLANNSKLKLFNASSSEFQNWQQWTHDKVIKQYNNIATIKDCEVLDKKITKSNSDIEICQLTFIEI